MPLPDRPANIYRPKTERKVQTFDFRVVLADTPCEITTQHTRTEFNISNITEAKLRACVACAVRLKTNDSVSQVLHATISAMSPTESLSAPPHE
mmetsp:Transcript_104552/g.180147  ORF Transcript_104552/g.180147 Transcript_104552/m.180147 type:complete len:94 (+) Transcript_104552:235-516(+)